MGKRSEIAAGTRVGLLTVLQRSEKKYRNNTVYDCLCDCGTYKSVLASNLRKGTVSCGCKRSAYLSSGVAARTHGLKNQFPRAYSSWKHMRRRCLHEHDAAWKWYGARGIKICERWSEFSLFVTDMGDRPQGFSLERVNNDGNYEPANCKWIPRAEQSKNRRPNGTVSRNYRRPQAVIADDTRIQ